MSWLDKLLPPKIQQTDPSQRKSIPEGLWVRCSTCESVLYWIGVEASLHAYPKCDHYVHISACARPDVLLGAEGCYELGQEIVPTDVLRFKDTKKHPNRIKAAMDDTGGTDAMIVVDGAIHALPVIVACLEFEFVGDSMGSVMGRRFTHDAQMALEQKVPFIRVSTTGGIRMQESLLSFMQMAKTTLATQKLAEVKLPFISVLTDPIMGGVPASLIFMGNVVIAEPEALIGFAGPRVIEQTVCEKPSGGFQRTEFLLQRGAIDMIVDRRNMRREVAELLTLLQKQPADALA